MSTVALPDELTERIRAAGQDVHHFAVAAIRQKLEELETGEQSAPPDPMARVDALLAELQRADKTPLRPNIPTHELFAQWAEEDARMTDEEREENDRIYAEIERNGIPRVEI